MLCRYGNTNARSKTSKSYFHTFQNGRHLKSAVSNFTESSGQTKIVIYVKLVVKVIVSFISSEKSR